MRSNTREPFDKQALCAMVSRLRMVDSSFKSCRQLVTFELPEGENFRMEATDPDHAAFFAPEDLPIAVVRHWRRDNGKLVTSCLVHHEDATIRIDTVEDEEPFLCPMRDDGKWIRHDEEKLDRSIIVESGLTEILVAQKRMYPGSFRRLDMRRALELNLKKGRRAGYSADDIAIPLDFRFYQADTKYFFEVGRNLQEILMNGKRAPRVAVIGGDRRVLEAEWPDDIEVVTYTGEPTNANRVLEAARAGRIDRVIVLSRWMGHSMWAQLRGGPVPVSAWPHGIPRLAKEMHAFLGFTPAPGVEVTDAPTEEPSPAAVEHEARAWREPVLKVCQDAGGEVLAVDVVELLGLGHDYIRVIRETLEQLARKGDLVRGDHGSVQKPTFKIAPAAPAAVPMPAGCQHLGNDPEPCDDCVRFAKSKRAPQAPTLVLPPLPPPVRAAALADPADAGRMEPGEEDALAKLGARWAQQTVRLARAKKEVTAARVRYEELNAAVQLLEEDVEKTRAEVERLSAAEEG